MVTQHKVKTKPGIGIRLRSFGKVLRAHKAHKASIIESMQESIFTKIIRGEIPCHKIYEDDKTLAFLDIHPQMTGHTLLIPKQQIDQLWDLPEDLYQHLWDVAKKIEQRLIEIIKSPRVGVAVEGFGVPHAHIHLIPLYKIEDFKKPQDMNVEPDHAKLAELAKRLAF